MRAFRGYVSPSRDGILSDRPEAAEHDRVEAADVSRVARSTSMPETGTAEERAAEGAVPDAAVQAMASLPVPEETPVPEGTTGKSRTGGLRRIFTGRVLAAALAINCLLVLLFALIMHLDAPEAPKYVYYINLTDRPADAGEPAEAGDAGDAGAADTAPARAAEKGSAPGQE